jgi:sarcosine oxidase delta subunit
MKLKQVEYARITCPYCSVGWHDLEIEVTGDSKTFDKNPRQCNTCKKFFRIRVNMSLEGRELES